MMKLQYGLTVAAACVWLLVGGFGSYAVAGGKVKSLSDLNCTPDQIAKFVGATWVCADDLDTTDTTAVDTVCQAGEALLGDGSCVDMDALLQQLDTLLSIHQIAGGGEIRFRNKYDAQRNPGWAHGRRHYL